MVDILKISNIRWNNHLNLHIRIKNSSQPTC